MDKVIGASDSDPEGIDSESDEEEEAGSFNDEEDVDSDGVMCMGEEGEMPGMWDDFGPVRNSEDSGLEYIPITQEEPSIIDSVSPNDYS
jgi:hypothetical protein